MSQMLLFPDPRPLVERLGLEFFRSQPDRPGIYLMRDAADAVLYVGKAKNLRKRLGSYRVANPDRMPRRHLRLLRAVARIELQECLDEASALLRESELLRALKPKFNRAGTWPGKIRYVAWQSDGDCLLLAVVESPETGWELFGPAGGAAHALRNVAARLLWSATHSQVGPTHWPAGWAQGRFEVVTRIPVGTFAGEASASLRLLFTNQPGVFIEWVRAKLPAAAHPFDRAAIESDLEYLSECASLTRGR